MRDLHASPICQDGRCLYGKRYGVKIRVGIVNISRGGEGNALVKKLPAS